ncbi:alpha/beta fold hydrolase [Actibacterium pelagium]|uniref:Hydrolase or acyltransferase (Alpha/beta hydrolase) n=1 Tax=Actibacterium pelagium TaxID=2029103 RepID=A0A917ACH0_9RHOB|nr:alpha/beta hydrolase [Actibacterium pelagium]GGE42038.1 hydrolase or acyltransferase (alpha/beta hydrolase) [Actibacterium pelagium]
MALSLAVILIAVLGVTQWRAFVREARAMASYPPEGQLLTVDGTQMHAVVRGDGPDLVLIHGSSGSTRDFTFSLMDKLAQDYRVIAIDRPGLGWSDWADSAETLSKQAELIRKTAQELGATSPLVLGQSYGGAVALAWALDAPQDVAGLVLLATPSHEWPTGLPGLYKATTNPVGRTFLVPLITAFVPPSYVDSQVEAIFHPQAAPSGYLDHFGPGMSLRRRTFRANGAQRKALKDQIVGMEGNYPSLQMPIEIVHGTADEIVGLDIHAVKLAHDVDSATLTPLEGIGHMPHHAAEADVVQAIHRAATRAGLR